MAKYDAEQLRTMAKNGQAMPDGAYPIADKEDLSNAVRAVGRGGANHDTIRRHIMKRAKALGASDQIPDNWAADGSLRAESDTGLSHRFVALDDISVRAGGDGRTVDAYAAIFGVASPVHDQDGDYDEIIDPAAFNRALEHRRGRPWPVLFNHGLTIFGTPDPDGSVPIGVAEEVRPDGRGLFTRTRFHKTPRADQVLEAIREGSVAGYSFSGVFRDSDPRKRGQYRGETVRRLESTLREFGPATFPVHQGAEIVGVRAEQIVGALAPGELERLAHLLRSFPEPGTSTDEVGPAAGDPPTDGHSTRSPRQQLLARRAAMIIKER